MPSFFSQLRNDPAVKGLVSTASDYVTAKAGSIGQPKGNGSSNGDDDNESVIDAGKKEAKRQAVGPAIKGFFSGAWNKLFKRKGSSKRPTNVVETAMVGAPVDVVWSAWTQYEEFPGYMKGPESVKQDQEEVEGEQKKTLTWQAKIFWSKRNWKSTIQEEVENERLRWTSEAAKGVVEGTVTFTPVGDNLTHILLILEYRPKGLFERTGNLWRSQGRRARLDFKHFNRHVTMSDQSEQADEEPEKPEESESPESSPPPEEASEQPEPDNGEGPDGGPPEPGAGEESGAGEGEPEPVQA